MTDEERLAMWKWVKENAIDHKMPMEQVHQVIDKEYFSGVTDANKPHWINEFLAARKTPFKRSADAVWAAQANRRAIQTQAKHLVNDKNATLLDKAFKGVIAAPRRLTLGTLPGVEYAHAQVFPFSHAGALLLNPTKWGAFARLVGNTWKNISPAHAEILRDTMTREPNFTLGQRNGLDISTHGNETGGGRVSARTWGALVEGRFRIWNAAMERHIDSGKYSPEEIDGIAKELATWANHATGSGKGVLTSSKYISGAFFGPKLAQSYWNRLIGDPVETLRTFSNWNNAEPGQKIVAMQRLRGSMWAAGTYTGMLMANQAFLATTGQKDKINWNDPSQSDWLGFKWGGMRWSLPGAMHTEINLVGQIIAAQTMSGKDLAAAGILVPHGNVSTPRMMGLREQYVARQLYDYALTKATPVVGLEEELRTGHDWMKRPLPWSSDQGDPNHPKMSWREYGLSKSPIPLSAAAGFVYDQLRHAGASVTDASMWIRAAMVAGLSATAGVDPKAIKDDMPHRTRGQTQVGH